MTSYKKRVRTHLRYPEEETMDYAKKALECHYEWQGKIEVNARAKVNDKESLSLAYTPGVAQPCLEINKDYSKSYEGTKRRE